MTALDSRIRIEIIRGLVSPAGGALCIQGPNEDVLIGVISEFHGVPANSSEIDDPFVLQNLLFSYADQMAEKESLLALLRNAPNLSYILPGNVFGTIQMMDLTGAVGEALRHGVVRAFRIEHASASLMDWKSLRLELGDRALEDPVGDVSAMSFTDRALLAVRLSRHKLGAEAQRQFEELLTPGALAVLAIGLGAVIGVLMTGIGAAVLLAVAWFMVGWSIGTLIGGLCRFLWAIHNAQDERDIDGAAALLAKVIVNLGVDLLLALIAGAVGKIAKATGGLAKILGKAAGSRSASKTLQKLQGKDIKTIGAKSGYIYPENAADEA